MSSVTADQKTVLFVDDDPAFLLLVGELVAQASHGKWNVIRADNAARALASLKEHNFDLLVVDGRMPVMSGLQFVRVARARFPDIPVVVLTGYADEPTRLSFANENVEILLEKPTSSEGFQTLFLTLHELIDLPRQQRFRGVMHDVELQDILQLECLRRNSSVLEVFSKSESGEIVIRNGGIVHAGVGMLRGEAAFYHLLNLKDGEFRLKPYREPAEPTISRHWEMLLMESAQLRDEGAGGENNSASTEEPAAAPLAKHFPALALTALESASMPATGALLVVSVEGRVLVNNRGDTARATALAELLRGTEWFKSVSGLGALELFEASTAAGQRTVLHFQSEALVSLFEEGAAR